MDGLNAVAQFRPDVVVLGIGMPGIDGSTHLTKPVDPAAFQELLAISHSNERTAGIGAIT